MLRNVSTLLKKLRPRKLWRNSNFRATYIGRLQDRYLDGVQAGSSEKMILFLIPGFDGVYGGILSIISLADETARLRDIHGAQVFVCTMPGDPALLKLTKFKNDATIVNVPAVLRRARPGTRLLLHIPEIFVERLASDFHRYAEQFPSLEFQFNILLQNIDLVPERSAVDRLSGYGVVTCTTAHSAYCNEATERLLGCSVHHFSVYVSPEQYHYRPYREKRNLIVVSPDKHPQRRKILQTLAARLPDYQFRVIRKMTYEKYKMVISHAKFSLTFGEGLDGYFVEPVFSGGIGCSVRNSRFFTEELGQLPFIYGTWEELESRFPGDVKAADSAAAYEAVHRTQFVALAEEYSHSKYLDNLRNFYQGYF